MGSLRRLRRRSCLHDRRLHVEKTPDSREATIGGSNPSANTGPAVLRRTNSVLRQTHRSIEIRAYSNKSTAVALPSRQFNYDEAVLLELSASFYGDMSEQRLDWKFRFQKNKFTDHLQEAVPREKFPEFIDYVRALKTEIDDVLLPRVRKERPSGDYIAAKTASEFLTAERILEDLALEERLDATMDKAIRRLAQAKALKQISGLNGRRRNKPAVLQIDVEKEDTLNNST
jgi:hypothetical protein